MTDAHTMNEQLTDALTLVTTHAQCPVFALAITRFKEMGLLVLQDPSDIPYSIRLLIEYLTIDEEAGTITYDVTGDVYCYRPDALSDAES